MGLFDIFTNKNAQDAANDQIAGLNQGYTDVSKLIGQGSNALTTNFTAALQPFLQNYNLGAGNAANYAGLLTTALSGDPSKITAQLQSSPGYQFTLNQGNENILRNAARTGSPNSGGTNIDLMKFGQGLADNTYQQYVGNLTSALQPFLGYSSNAASGIGSVDTGLGQDLNTNYGTLANAAWAKDTGAANAQANADLANNQASGNFWNLLGGVAGLGVKGGGTLGGNLLSGLPLLSDMRAKDDIEPVGKLNDGTNIYRYRYKGDPTMRIGVMAQEVEKTNPDAVHEINGWKTVDYGKATDFAAKLAPFLKAD